MIGTPSPPESPPPTPAPVVTGHLPPVAPRPKRTLLYVGVAVAVALLLVLLYFVVLAAPSSSSSSGAAGTDLTYSQAKPIANSAMSGYKGGGWALLFAAGVDSNSSVTEALNSTAFSSSNCTFTPVSSSGTITIPATSVSRSAGEAPAWEFAYRNASDTIALADVVSGKGAVVGTLGGMCTTYFAYLSVVPSVVDSSEAAAHVAAEPGVSAFLKADPNATAEFGLIGGLSVFGLSIGSEWSVNYSSCSIGPSASGFGTVANGTVNGTTGAVVYSEVRSGVACASITTHTVGSSVAFPQLATHPGPPIWYYNFTATTAAHSITWANLSPEIFTGEVPVTTPWTINATTSGGTLIATINSTTDTWSAGAAQLIALGDHLNVTSDVDITYDTLVLTGVGQFTGTLDLSLL